jgi:uncharacterized protein YjbJ (UPF0337 family)
MPRYSSNSAEFDKGILINCGGIGLDGVVRLTAVRLDSNTRNSISPPHQVARETVVRDLLFHASVTAHAVTHQGENVMNTDIIQGKWHQLKGSVKAQWGKLTDDELDQVDGNAEKLVGLVQERYGYAKQRAEQEVDSFFARQKM